MILLSNLFMKCTWERMILNQPLSPRKMLSMFYHITAADSIVSPPHAYTKLLAHSSNIKCEKYLCQQSVRILKGLILFRWSYKNVRMIYFISIHLNIMHASFQKENKVLKEKKKSPPSDLQLNIIIHVGHVQQQCKMISCLWCCANQ